MSTSNVRIGIVGLGRLGRRHLQNLVERVPHAQVVAACSPLKDELAWAQKAFGIDSLHANYADLLAHPELDAVFLVTPTSVHSTQIIDGLRAGKHVFCEKPLSLELTDCHRVEEETAKYPHLKVMIGFVRR